MDSEGWLHQPGPPVLLPQWQKWVRLLEGNCGGQVELFAHEERLGKVGRTAWKRESSGDSKLQPYSTYLGITKRTEMDS